MGTIVAAIAALVLAGATTLSIVATQQDAPSGGGIPKGGTVVTYEQGQ